MGCPTCKSKKERNMMNTQISEKYPYPFMASDIQVVNTVGVIQPFEQRHWGDDKHKLLVIIPEAFTPVCETELGAINSWQNEFKKLGCRIIAVSADQPRKLKDWFDEEELLKERYWHTFSSYLIPQKLRLMSNGRPIRSSVFIMDSGEIVKQEHFEKVGRSFSELHRMLYGYTTDSYCAEGWKDPSDSIKNYRGKEL